MYKYVYALFHVIVYCRKTQKILSILK